MTFNPVESMVGYFRDTYHCQETHTMRSFIEVSKQHKVQVKVYPPDHLSHTNPELWKKKQEKHFKFLVTVAHVMIGKSMDPNFLITPKQEKAYRKYIELSKNSELKKAKADAEKLAEEITQTTHFSPIQKQKILDLISKIFESIKRIFSH